MSLEARRHDFSSHGRTVCHRSPQQEAERPGVSKTPTFSVSHQESGPGAWGSQG